MPVADVLAELLEFKWRDVSFPVTEFETNLEQDLVEHKWPQRDGAHVEATGRAPLVITATIPFRNFVAPGKSESWGRAGRDIDGTIELDQNEILYPIVFRKFVIAMSTRSSGPLQHPEFGIIQCKPKNAHCKWLSTRRDGCDVHATWVESLDDTVSDFEDILARKSPIPLADVASSDLDQQIADFGVPLVTTDADSLAGISFSDQIQSITSSFDAASLVSSQYAGQIDHVLYRIDSLEDRITALGDVTAWPLISSCERTKSALHDLKTLLLTTDSNVLTFYTLADTTLAALTVQTKATIDELLILNPSLVQQSFVPAFTKVRYYKKAA